MEKYKVLEAIGQGSFGRVFRGKCISNGHIVALKFIPKRNKVERELKSLRRECEIQRGLSHPNIVRMIDSFETENEVVAVSEYVPGQLFQLLESNGPLKEDKVQKIACNLVSAIYYLHSHRILHRDIKPQNILLSSTGDAKLCDFGFSRKMGINTYVLTSVKGTPLYMAPELIEEKPYDHNADVWSLGCILYELLTGKPPFCTTSIVQLIKMVRTEPVCWSYKWTPDCTTFLQGVLEKDPSERLTWPQLLEHPWVHEGVVFVQHSLNDKPLTNPLTVSQQQVKEQQCKELAERNGKSQMMEKPPMHEIGLTVKPKVAVTSSKPVATTPVTTRENSHMTETSLVHCLQNISRKEDCHILPQIDMKVMKQLEAVHLNATENCYSNDLYAASPCPHKMRRREREKMISVHISSSTDNSPCHSIEETDTTMYPLQKIVIEAEIHDDARESVTSTRGLKDYVNDTRSAVGASVRKLSRLCHEPGFNEEDVKDLQLYGPLPVENRKDSMANYLANSIDSSRRGSRPSNPMVELLQDGRPSLPNINEESCTHFMQDRITTALSGKTSSAAVFTLHSFNSEERPLETEEWCQFIDKTVADTLNGNYSVFLEQTELTLFISPLRNHTCSLKVTNRLVALLQLPFTVISLRNSLAAVVKVYLECKVVPNLVYHCKLICKAENQKMNVTVEFDKDQIDTMGDLMLLICHLLYYDKDFLLQFCDCVCVLNTFKVLRKILTLDSVLPSLVADTLAILNHILRSLPENYYVVEQIIGIENSTIFLLETLITHKVPLVRARLCTLIGYLAKCCPQLSKLFEGQHKLISDLINLESDLVQQVRKSASFAVSCLQEYTDLILDDL